MFWEKYFEISLDQEDGYVSYSKGNDIVSNYKKQLWQ